MTAQVPKRGDPIIVRQQDAFGQVKLTATRAFQVFLESLQDNQDLGSLEQQIASLFATYGSIKGNLGALSKDVLDVEQSDNWSVLALQRARLNREIDAREDLEQFVYGN